VTSHQEICLSLDPFAIIFPKVAPRHKLSSHPHIFTPQRKMLFGLVNSFTLSVVVQRFSVHRHVDDRLHDFSPGQPAFGHDACGAHLFTQPCNGLYISRILPCHALGGSNIVLGSCWEIEKVCRTANHSAFDRLAIPRTSVPARLCLCRCGWFLVNSPMTCVYRLDISSFEYSRV